MLPVLEQMGYERFLEREEMASLAMSAQNGDRKASDTLIMRNRPFLWARVRKWHRPGCPVSKEDLFSEAMIGFVKGIDKFDPSCGASLLTYSTFWVDAYIARRLMDEWSIVRAFKTNEDRAAFFRSKGVEPSLGSIEGRVALQMRPPVSMDAPIGKNGDRTVGETMLDLSPRQDEQYEEMEEQLEAKKLLSKAMESLNEKERLVIEKRYLEEPALIFDALGELLGVSRERVRQIEMRALDKIISGLEVKNLDSRVLVKRMKSARKEEP